MSGSRNTIGYIKPDGTIENSSRSTLGYIKNDGTIEDKSRNTIGYIKNDGTIENKSRSTVGYVKKDGTVILLKDSITRPNGIAFFPSTNRHGSAAYLAQSSYN